MVRFKEVQRFNQWWFYAIIIILLGPPLYGYYHQIIKGDPWGNNPMSDGGLILYIVFSMGLAWFLTAIKLTTEITDQSIKGKLFPMAKKEIKWEDVASAQIINYGFVGYGLRVSFKHGTVYNIGGKYGLAIVTKSGKKWVLGTQEPDRMKAKLKDFLTS